MLPLNPQLPTALLSTLLPSLGVSHFLSVAPPDADFPVSCNPLHYPDNVTDETPPERQSPEWQASRLATLTLTSGSSGLPKAVAHAFSAHIASAQGVIELMAFTAQDSWLLLLPLFHVSGQGIVWRWLTAGGRDWCCAVRNRWSTRCRIVRMPHWCRRICDFYWHKAPCLIR